LSFRTAAITYMEMNMPTKVPPPPVIALAVAAVGIAVIAFNLRPDRHGETMSSVAKTDLSARAAGATVSPTDDAIMGP
jgi:hypothetical protein